VTRGARPPARPEAAPEAIRLDKWLWQARFAKTRGGASDLIARGAVRLNARRISKPATLVRVGDGLAFVQGGRVRVVRVSALGDRRGPAAEARTLYHDLDGPPDGPQDRPPPPT